MTGTEIANLAEARMDCRIAHNWTQADSIKCQLQEADVSIEDTKQGCRWHKTDWTEGGEIRLVETSPDLQIRDFVLWQNRHNMQRQEVNFARTLNWFNWMDEEGSHGGR